MNNEAIVLTGPESSGKTTLANQLSACWQVPLVQEVSRDYLKNKTSYQQHDLLKIGKQQYKQELAALSNCSGKIVCDTDLLVIMIWSEVKYGHCDSWIYKTFEDSINQKSLSRYYYLCDFNIPWQDDPLRENPNNRDELFAVYLQKIKEYELKYSIVKGNPQERLQYVLKTSVS